MIRILWHGFWFIFSMAFLGFDVSRELWLFAAIMALVATFHAIKLTLLIGRPT